MRSSKFVIRSDAQKVMAKLGVGCRFHDLKYFEVVLFFIFLKFFVKLKVALQEL